MSTLPSLFVSNDRDGTAATAGMAIASTDASPSAIAARVPRNFETSPTFRNGNTVAIGVLLETIGANQNSKIRARDQSVPSTIALPQQMEADSE
jgi:hypothetical protein